MTILAFESIRRPGVCLGWESTHRLGKDDSPQCRHCGEGEDTGDHLVFECKRWKELRWEVWIEAEARSRSWNSWEDMDSGAWLTRERDGEGNWIENDFVREFMEKITLFR